jgi:multidrug resistance protein MdtO
MSAQDQALTAVAPSNPLDEAGRWFWQFLKDEFAPFPGRASTVARMVISATVVMLLVMTFRVPYGFLGAIYTLLLTRENPTLTFRSGVRTLIAYTIATLYTVIGVMTLIADPLTHFLWITISLFLAFYLIRIVPDYMTAVGFGFTLAGAIPLWDETFLTVNQRTENTLWLGFSVILGTVVTVAVEYVFHRVQPVTDLNIGIQSRLRAIEDLLRQIGSGEFHYQKQIALYASLGTSRLRRMISRSSVAPEYYAQMIPAIGLLGRLVSLAGSLQTVLSKQASAAPEEDRQRCLRLAEQIAVLERDVRDGRLPSPLPIPHQSQAAAIPLLAEMERTVALTTHAFSRSREDVDVSVVAVADQEHQPLFAADAFTNPDHLKFAIRGTLATMLAYCVYTGIAWPGLSTAVATCIITALSTIGSSRQKQFLRLGGAIIGGFLFGMGAQIFVLPYLDSITGFAVLFAAVTAISAWISTATPRLSYLGLQLALAFYLINVQEFAPQFSLAIARDRVVGVLLGLVCMWLVFDRLWVRNALDEMQDAFARNLRLMAKLIGEYRSSDPEEAIERVIRLRDQINDGFVAVRAQADAVLFEFGPSRPRKLKMRDDFRLWQPTLGTLTQVEMTYLQYLWHSSLPQLSPTVKDALSTFQEDLASAVQSMAEEVSGQPARVAPDMPASAALLRLQVQQEYGDGPLPPEVADMATLSENLASIVAPLIADVHRTFSDPALRVMHHPVLKPERS